MKMLRGFILSCAVFIAFASNAQCGKMELKQSETEVCLPSLVKFHLTQVPRGSKVEWTIDGKAVVSLDTFYHLFETQGSFDVTALVTLPGGSTCSISKADAVVSHKLPVPIFKVSRKLLCNGPDTVTFTDQTSNVFQRSWIIDGTNYNNGGKELVHSFSTSGQKPVDLIVLDSNGCRNVLRVDSVIEIYNKPLFQIEADIHDGCQGQQIQFEIPTASRANAKKYILSFEGATPSQVINTPNPKISYNQAGQFDVSAKVETHVGCTYNYIFPEYINLGKKVNLDILDVSTTGCLGDTITVIEKNQYEGGIYKYEVVGADTTNQKGGKTDVVLSDTGWIDVNVYYVDNGCLSVKKHSKIVRVGAVDADFTSDNNNHCKYPHTIDLKSDVNDYGSPITSYHWNIIQDKKVIAQRSGSPVQFTSDSFGLYDVELEVTNDLGCKDVRLFTDFIRVMPMGIVVSAHSLIGCVGSQIDIVNSTPASTFQTKDKFNWTISKDGKKITTSKDKGLSINLSDTGYYDVHLIGYNAIGCRDTFYEKKAIRVVESEIGYHLPEQNICHGDSFTMVGRSKPSDVNYSYSWSIQNKHGISLLSAQGDSVTVMPPQSGMHDVVMYHQIGTGCKDTVVIKKALGVNILRANIDLDTTNGCPGMVVSPSADPYANLHFGSEDSTVSVKWSMFTRKDHVLDDISGNPIFTLNKKGYYQIQADVTNSMGCVNTVISDTIFVGNEAIFEFDAGSFCMGDSIGIQNLSILKPTRCEWILPKNTTLSTVKNKTLFSTANPGSYEVGLVASKNGQCPDTAFRNVEMIQTVADFRTEDTFLFCAPVYAQFESLSTFADSLEWHFGDGSSVVTVDKKVANIYKRNMGTSDGYDVKLIARHKVGCTDTLLKEDLVVVTGPVPDFTVDKLVGCDTLDVRILNKSKDYSHVVMDYRDGSQTDSTSELKHRYEHTVAGNESMYFSPRIIITDESGCVATKVLDTFITIHKGAQLYSLLDRNISRCVPFTLEASAGNYNASKAAWHYNGDEFNSGSVNIAFQESGEYVLNYVGSNELCTDTIKHTVIAHAKPEARILAADTMCKDSLVKLADNSRYIDGFELNKWSIDGIEYTNEKEVFHSHESFGEKVILLEIRDKNGCQSQTTKKVKIPSPGEMKQPLIHYISYDEGDQIDVKMPARQNAFIKNTELFHNGTFLQGIKSNSQTDITFNNPATPNCVYVSTQDYCNNQSNPSFEHCAIEIGAIPMEGGATITWTAYQGWEEVEKVSVYRSIDGKRYSLIAEVPGDVQSYIDQNLCPQTYYYKVIAMDAADRNTSSSRAAIVVPDYNFDSPNVPVQYVTVVKNKAIKVVWDSSGYDSQGHFIIEKFDQNNVLTESIQSNGNQYFDKRAYVKNESYTYRVFFEDHCGFVTKPSRVGTSMRLKGYSKGYDKHLEWNHYKDWKTGVRSYTVQSMIDGEFRTIIQLPGNINRFKDTLVYQSGKGDHCYRIVAVSGNEKDSSYSNETCVADVSKVMMPNAFSPNGDGVNDVFKPFGHYLDYSEENRFTDYSFRIYNRYGELIYLSEGNENGGWNGTYNGKRCNPGVFIYHLSVIGADGVPHHKTGTVTLIR